MDGAAIVAGELFNLGAAAESVGQQSRARRRLAHRWEQCPFRASLAHLHMTGFVAEVACKPAATAVEASGVLQVLGTLFGAS